MHFGLRIALASLSTHKLRTVLAMLGVFLGALALTGVQHVSQAMVRKAEIETEKLGPNLFLARSGNIRFRRSGGTRFSGDANSFKVGDAYAVISGMPSALNGAPFLQKSMQVRSGSVKIPTTLVGSTPQYQHIRSLEMAQGRFFNEEETQSRALVCVLGAKIAERLFGKDQQAVGKDVYFFRARLRVVGVLAPKGADISGTDQDEQALVPLSTAMRRMANVDAITGVYVELAPHSNPDQAKEAATSILRQRHDISPGQRDDFSVLTARDTLQLQQQALDLVGILGLISSSVSFAVGGLGILSIMILLVRTRRLEIGVRRAVGARRGDIVAQFLFESGLLSGVGGTLGVIVALGLISLVYALGIFPAVFDPLLILAVPLGSVALGVAAGSYPAWQASRYEILDILRTRE